MAEPLKINEQGYQPNIENINPLTGAPMKIEAAPISERELPVNPLTGKTLTSGPNIPYSPEIPVISGKLDRFTQGFNIATGSLNEFGAQNQTVGNRVAKFLPRVLSTAAREVAKMPGVAVGLSEWAASGFSDYEKAFDNVWINAMDEADEYVKENWLKVYTPYQVQNGNLATNLTSASFWANEGAEGVGFLLSMLVPGAAIKGAAVGTNALKAMTSLGKYSKLIKPGFKMSQRMANNLDDVLAVSANTLFEAAAEGSEIYKRSYRAALEQGYTEEKARQIAGSAASKTFGANMLILAGPNILAHKMLFNGFRSASRVGTRRGLQRLVDPKTGKFIEDAAPLTWKQKGSRIAKNVFTQAAVEGFWEEGMQFAAGEYFTDLALGLEDGNWISGVLSSYFENLSNIDMQKGIFLGSFLGGIMGGVGTYRQSKAEDQALFGKSAVNPNFIQRALGIESSKGTPGLKKLLQDNLINRHTSIMDLIAKDADGNPLFDENGEIKLDEKKVQEFGQDVVRQQLEDKMQEAFALTGNKEGFDFIRKFKNLNYMLPFLQQEGGYEILKQHINELAELDAQALSEMPADMLSALTGARIDPKQMDKGQQVENIRQELLKDAEDFKKIVEDLNDTHTINLNLNVTEENKEYADEFSEVLYNQRLTNSVAQTYFNSRIPELEREIAELEAVENKSSKVQKELKAKQTQLDNYLNDIDNALERESQLWDPQQINREFAEYVYRRKNAEKIARENKLKTYQHGDFITKDNNLFKLIVRPDGTYAVVPVDENGNETGDPIDITEDELLTYQKSQPTGEEYQIRQLEQEERFNALVEAINQRNAIIQQAQEAIDKTQEELDQVDALLQKALRNKPDKKGRRYTSVKGVRKSTDALITRKRELHAMIDKLNETIQNNQSDINYFNQRGEQILEDYVNMEPGFSISNLVDSITTLKEQLNQLKQQRVSAEDHIKVIDEYLKLLQSFIDENAELRDLFKPETRRLLKSIQDRLKKSIAVSAKDWNELDNLKEELKQLEDELAEQAELYAVTERERKRLEARIANLEAYRAPILSKYNKQVREYKAYQEYYRKYKVKQEETKKEVKQQAEKKQKEPEPVDNAAQAGRETVSTENPLSDFTEAVRLRYPKYMTNVVGMNQVNEDGTLVQDPRVQRFYKFLANTNLKTGNVSYAVTYVTNDMVKGISSKSDLKIEENYIDQLGKERGKTIWAVVTIADGTNITPVDVDGNPISMEDVAEKGVYAPLRVASTDLNYWKRQIFKPEEMSEEDFDNAIKEQLEAYYQYRIKVLQTLEAGKPFSEKVVGKSMGVPQFEAQFTDNNESRRKAAEAGRSLPKILPPLSGWGRGIEKGDPLSIHIVGRNGKVALSTGTTSPGVPGSILVLNKKTGNIYKFEPRNLNKKEVKFIIDLFKLHVSKLKLKGNKVDITDKASWQVESTDGQIYDIFSDIIENMVHWTGTNVTKDGKTVNSNTKTAFHIVNSKVPGRQVQVGEAVYNLVDQTKLANGELALDPQLEAAMETFLAERFVQVKASELNKSNTAYIQFTGLDSKGKVKTKLHEGRNGLPGYETFLLGQTETDFVIGSKFVPSDQTQFINQYLITGFSPETKFSTIGASFGSPTGKLKPIPQDILENARAINEFEKDGVVFWEGKKFKARGIVQGKLLLVTTENGKQKVTNVTQQYLAVNDTQEVPETKTTEGKVAVFSAQLMADATAVNEIAPGSLVRAEVEGESVNLDAGAVLQGRAIQIVRNADGTVTKTDITDKFVPATTESNAQQAVENLEETAEQNDESIPETLSNELGMPSEEDIDDEFYDEMYGEERRGRRTNRKENVELFNKWFEDTFGDVGIDIEVTKHLINQRAHGLFTQNAIYLWENAEVGTGYHESFHMVFQLFLTDKQRMALIKEVQNDPKFAAKIEEAKQLYPDKPYNIILEEVLAEEFADYVLNEGRSVVRGKQKKGFFAKLYDYIVKLYNWILGRPTIESTYNNILRGTFKNQRPIGKSRPSERRVISGLNQAQTNELIDTVNFKFLQYVMSSPDNIEKLFSPDFNADLVRNAYISVQNYLKQTADKFNTIIQKPTTSPNLASSLNNSIKIINIALNNFATSTQGESVVDIHRKVLRRYNIEINEEEELGLEEERTQDSLGQWGYNSLKVETSKSANSIIKMLIASLPESKVINGRVVPLVNSLKLEKGLPYSFTIHLLFNSLANTRDPNKFLQKLDKLQALDPRLKYVSDLVERIGLNILADPDKGAEALSFDTVNKAMYFAQAFAKNKNNFKIGYLNSDSTMNFLDSNQDTIKDAIKKKWQDNMSGAIHTKAITLPEDVAQAVLELKKLGIEFKAIPGDVTNQKVLRALELANIDPAHFLNRAIETLRDVKEGRTVNIYDDSLNEVTHTGDLNLFTNIEYEATVDYLDNNHFNIAGDRVYDVTLGHYVSFIVNDFNSVATRDELFELHPHLNSALSRNSQILKLGGKFFDENGNRIKDIELDIIEGLVGNTSDLRRSFERLSPTDKLGQQFSGILKGYYHLLRTSSNKVERRLNFGTFFQSNTGQEVMSAFMAYLEDELDAIKEVYTGEKYKSYDGTVLDGVVISAVKENWSNFDDSFSTFLDSEMTAKEFIKEFSLKARIGQALSKWLDSVTKDNLELLKDTMVIQERAEDYILNSFDLPQGMRFTDNKKLAPKQAVEAFVRNATLNDLAANIEQYKLLTGNPLQYNKVGAFFKRMSGIVGPKSFAMDWAALDIWLPNNLERRDGKNIENSNYNGQPIVKTAVFNDPRVQARYYELYKSILGESRSEPYAEMEEPDGFGFISLDEYREFKFRAGYWSQSLEDLYQWEKAFDEIQTVEEYQSHMSNIPVNPVTGDIAVFNSLKPHYFGPLAEEGFIQGMYKLSLMPVLPSASKYVEGNQLKSRKLAEIDEFFKNTRTGILTFASANKIGTKLNEDGEVQPLYKDGNLNLDKLTFQNSYYKYWGVQVDTKNSVKYKSTSGTQMAKQIISNLSSGGKFVPMRFVGKDGAVENENLPEVISKLKSALKTERLDDLLALEEAPQGLEEEFEYFQRAQESTENRVAEYIRLNTARLEKNLKSLIEMLGVAQNEQGEWYTQNSKKLIETLSTEVINRDLPDNLAESLSFVEKGLGIEVLVNSDRFESILFSLADKRVVKKSRIGGQKIQVPSTLFEATGTSRTKIDDKGNVYQASDLQFYNLKDKDGNIVDNIEDAVTVGQAEVYLPHWFKEVLLNDFAIEDYQLDPRLLEIIGFRIPTQGLNSIESLVVKDFLPPSAGEAIILPSEIVAKAGSDYDIDKLNIYVPHYKIRGTRIDYVEYLTEQEDNPEAEVDRYITYMRASVRDYHQIVKENLDDRIEMLGEIDELYRKIDTAVESLEVTQQRAQEAYDEGYADFSQLPVAIRQQYYERNNEDTSRGIAKVLNNLEFHRQWVDILKAAEDTVSIRYVANVLGKETDLVYTLEAEELAETINTLENLINSTERYLELVNFSKEALIKIKETRKEVKGQIPEIKKEFELNMYNIISEQDPNVPTFTEFINRPIEQQNTYEAIENRLIEIYKDLIASPDNFYNLINPIGNRDLKNDFYEIMYYKAKQAGKARGKSLEQFAQEMEADRTPLRKVVERSHLHEVEKAMVGGKRGIGINAVQATNTILSQYADLYMNLDLKFKHNAKVLDDGTTAVSLSNLTTVNGENISEIISQLINAFVDAESDPFILQMNVTPDTVTIYSLLIRAGVPRKEVSLFMNQPAVIEYMKMRAINNSITVSVTNNRMSRKAMRNTLLRKYRPKPVEQFTLKALQDGIAKDPQKNLGFQGAVLEHLFELENNVQAITDMTIALSLDTKGTGRNSGDLLYRLNKLTEIMATNDSLGNFGNLLSGDAFLGAYKKILYKIEEIYSPYLQVFNNKSLNQVFTDFVRIYNTKGPFPFIVQDEISGAVTKFKNDFITALVLSNELNINGNILTGRRQPPISSNIKEVFETTVAQLRYAKNDLKFRSNKLIQNLQIEDTNFVLDGKKLSSIYLEMDTNNPDYKDEMADAWRELFDLEMANFPIATNLAKFAFAQSGLAYSRINFTDIIPSEIYGEMLTSALQGDLSKRELFEANNPDSSFTDFYRIFFMDFFKHNSNNNAIVPKATSYFNQQTQRTEYRPVNPAFPVYKTFTPTMVKGKAAVNLPLQEKKQFIRRGGKLFQTRLFLNTKNPLIKRMFPELSKYEIDTEITTRGFNSMTKGNRFTANEYNIYADKIKGSLFTNFSNPELKVSLTQGVPSTINKKLRLLHNADFSKILEMNKVQITRLNDNFRPGQFVEILGKGTDQKLIAQIEQVYPNSYEDIANMPQQDPHFQLEGHTNDKAGHLENIKYLKGRSNVVSIQFRIVEQEQRTQTNPFIVTQIKGKSKTPGEAYAIRSRANASQAPVTIGMFVAESASKKIAESAANSAGNLFIDAFTPNDVSNRGELTKKINTVVQQINRVDNASEINIVGSSIDGLLKNNIDQEKANNFMLYVLSEIVKHPDLKTPITRIRSGGQTGIDEAGMKAALKLGVNIYVLSANGFWVRTESGKDRKLTEKQFTSRFTSTSKQVDKIIKDRTCK